jgi:neutral amino acid transport system permease protein
MHTQGAGATAFLVARAVRPASVSGIPAPGAARLTMPPGSHRTLRRSQRLGSPRMEATSLPAGAPSPTPWRRFREFAAENPAKVFLAVMALFATYLLITDGLQLLAQRSINGLVSGSYLALGAIGLTLVYGILRLTNFAHGDMLTMGAYIAFVFNVTIGVPFVIALVAAILLSAAAGVFFEFTLWRPMRKRKAGTLQLLLMTIGLAFVIRYVIQFIAGSEQKSLDIDTTSSITFLDLSIGRTQLIVVVIAFVVLTAVAMMLKYTSLGRQMRALADNFDLAETTGIDTGRVVVYTWILSAGLAGLAGVLVIASIGSLNPNTGFSLLLPLFAAVVLGGIGNAFGALAGGIVIGLTQEWSTLIVASQWKVAVSFVVLVVVLIFRPQGIFGSERTL